MPASSADAARRVPDVAELVALGRAQGLDAVGVAPARPFASTRHHLEDRKARGLHGGMAFTYREPARSTDPGAALPDARSIVVAARSYLRPHPPGPGGPADPGVAGDPGSGDPGSGDHDDPAGPGSRSGWARSSTVAGPASGGDADADRPGPHRRPTGVVARYAWTDHYRPLRAALQVVARALKAEGWRARVVADDNALVDRAAAQRAGLGWYGKNANLLLPGQGSWFVLGSVITDAPLVVEPPEPVGDGCGSCRRCLDGCPTGAIVAPGVVDARRCLAWLLQIEGPFPHEHRVALGDRLYGCDDCQEVCPPNRRLSRRPVAATAADIGRLVEARGRGVPAGPGQTTGARDMTDEEAFAGDAGGEGRAGARAVIGARGAAEVTGTAALAGASEAVDGSAAGEQLVAAVDVLDLLAASDDELLARHGRWYVPRRQARYLRRNALVVLGNVGDPADPAVATALSRALAGEDPLVRGHAVWAARRLGRTDLLDAVASDDDPLVRHELDAPVEARR
jgi:epoxyqueuosine reductase